MILIVGTEPKLKYYSEMRGATMEEARDSLHLLVTAFCRDLLQPELNGLMSPAE
jgi:hypothetical protein